MSLHSSHITGKDEDVPGPKAQANFGLPFCGVPEMVFLVEALRAHQYRLQTLHKQDRAAKLAGDWMPEGLEREFRRLRSTPT